eukprot:3559045-Amphidinium_carterae.1
MAHQVVRLLPAALKGLHHSVQLCDLNCLFDSGFQCTVSKNAGKHVHHFKSPKNRIEWKNGLPTVAFPLDVCHLDNACVTLVRRLR